MAIFRAITILLSLAGVGSCASDPPTRELGVLTVAVAGDHVFVGKSVSFGFQGNFSLSTITLPEINCTGRFRYRARASRGKANYICDNNMKGSLRIIPEGGLRGTGEGQTPLGPMKAVFGYSMIKVNELFSFPDDGHLIYANNEFKLTYPE